MQKLFSKFFGNLAIFNLSAGGKKPSRSEFEREKRQLMKVPELQKRAKFIADHKRQELHREGVMHGYMMKLARVGKGNNSTAGIPAWFFEKGGVA